MRILTSRFGPVQVDQDEVLTFGQGLIGFGRLQRFALIPSQDNPRFQWLQSLDDPEVAFLTVEPGLFFKDYAVSIREETEQELLVRDVSQVRLLVICNRAGDWLTGNLRGPIVINPQARLAMQVVLTDKKWTTRQPLARLEPEQRLAKAA